MSLQYIPCSSFLLHLWLATEELIIKHDLYTETECDDDILRYWGGLIMWWPIMGDTDSCWLQSSDNNELSQPSQGNYSNIAATLPQHLNTELLLVVRMQISCTTSQIGEFRKWNLKIVFSHIPSQTIRFSNCSCNWSPVVLQSPLFIWRHLPHLNNIYFPKILFSNDHSSGAAGFDDENHFVSTENNWNF